MRTGEELRAQSADVVWHVPRHPDEPCNCPTALCGLAVPRAGCEPHRDAMATLAMQIHPDRRCPKLEPHHRAAHGRTEDETEAPGVPVTPTEGRSGATGRLSALSRASGAESQMPIPGVCGGRRAENGAGSVAEDPRAASDALSATDGGRS